MDLLAEKAQKLAARRQAAKKLSSDVDAELRAGVGCLPCSFWRRKREPASAEDVEIANAAATSTAEGRAKAGTASAQNPKCNGTDPSSMPTPPNDFYPFRQQHRCVKQKIGCNAGFCDNHAGM